MRLYPSTLALLLVLTFPSAIAKEPARLPPVAFTLGMLTTFIDTADAYRTLCAKHVSAGDLQSYVGAWFERNQRLIDQILDVGRKAKWYSSDRSSETVWVEMRERDAARFREHVAQVIEPNPKMMCIDGMRPFKDGSYELEYFPFHLKALGISVP